jgi:hypothetical protein
MLVGAVVASIGVAMHGLSEKRRGYMLSVRRHP